MHWEVLSFLKNYETRNNANKHSNYYSVPYFYYFIACVFFSKYPALIIVNVANMYSSCRYATVRVSRCLVTFFYCMEYVRLTQFNSTKHFFWFVFFKQFLGFTYFPLLFLSAKQAHTMLIYRFYLKCSSHAIYILLHGVLTNKLC